MGIWLPELCIALFTIIVILNFIQICCIVKRILKPGRYAPYRHILLSLAVSDFLIGINGFVIASEFYDPQIYIICTQLRATALFSLQFLTVDRVLAVYRPLTQRRILSLARVRLIIVAYWIISILCGIVLFHLALAHIMIIPTFRQSIATIMMVLAVIQIASYSAICLKMRKRRRSIYPIAFGVEGNEAMVRSLKTQTSLIKLEITSDRQETMKYSDMESSSRSTTDRKENAPYKQINDKVLFLDIEKVNTIRVSSFKKDRESRAFETRKAEKTVTDSYDYTFPSPHTYRQQKRENFFRAKPEDVSTAMSKPTKLNSPMHIMKRQEKRIFYIAVSYCVSFCCCLLPLAICILFFPQELASKEGNIGIVYILAFAFSIFNPCIYFATNYKEKMAILKQYVKGKLQGCSETSQIQ